MKLCLDFGSLLLTVVLLQRMIKRTLTEMGCPPHILDDLMENCHERRWPPGLCSLETRQNNRRQYDYYVCKRVPGKQAVLLLSCDNSHMGEDMMVEPGLVMIFAHGIEWETRDFPSIHDIPLALGHFDTWNKTRFHAKTVKSAKLCISVSMYALWFVKFSFFGLYIYFWKVEYLQRLFWFQYKPAFLKLRGAFH